MLASVHIENIALINKLDIDFTDGFITFTGETGAGKSILIDSINMVAGSRMNKDIIRTGTDYCNVSAVFSEISDTAADKIEEYGISVDQDRMLIVQRNLTVDGKSVSKINGRTVPNSLVKKICSFLINIYGQNDFLTLTDPEAHIQYIDSYCDCQDIKTEYKSQYEKLMSIKNEISVLEMDQSEKTQKIDFLKFQLSELESANIKPGEEEKLNQEKKRVLNYEKITTAADNAYSLLYGSEKRGVYNNLSTAIEYIEELSDIIPSLKADSERLTDYLYEIRDIAEKVLNHKPGANNQDPTKLLDNIEERLDLIYRLKKKYNMSADDLIRHMMSIREKLNKMELSDETLANLEKEYSANKQILFDIALNLSDKRKSAAEELERKVKEQFEFLDMPGVIFKADFQYADKSDNDGFMPDGIDKVEFLVSTNAGEPLKPMAKIASGGELSRIMLAIKSVLALNDDISTIIFDEIDTGISGKTSHKVGINLKKLSKSIQVFCVTHSAQVASLATTHFKIEKELNNGRMETKVKQLDKSMREDEIARILGGIDLTDSAKRTASELIEQGKNY